MIEKTGKIPDKHFYTIGDVSQMTHVKPYILRYWESQFKVLRPARRYSGHRKYTIREIDLINKIRYLIVDRKYTLSGAVREVNRQLNGNGSSGHFPETNKGPDFQKALLDVKKEIDDCLSLLNGA